MLGVRMAVHLLAREREVVAHHWTHPLPEALAPYGLRADLLDAQDACHRAVRQAEPDVVVNCVGLTNVDQCESEPEQAALLNERLAGRLAAAAHEHGCRFVQISTDHLSDGTCRFITEEAPPHPVNVYARTKLAGEVAVRDAYPRSLILRTNFFGPSLAWRKSFNDWLTERLSQGAVVNAFTDVFFTPVASNLLSAMVVELIDRDVSGVLNLAGRDRVSKYDFACQWAAHAGLDTALIHVGSVEESNLAAPRPHDMSLDCSKAEAILGRTMPSLQESLRTYSQVLVTH